MANKIKVKSAFPKQPDGGFKVAIFERDDRHPDGELFIADDKEHSVEVTPEVRAALADGRLVEVRSDGTTTAPADNGTSTSATTGEGSDTYSFEELMGLKRAELDALAESMGVEGAAAMETKADVATAIVAKQGQ